MPIVIVIISILAITGAVWFLNKVLPFTICPICAGVAGTWLWMFAGMLSGLLPVTNYQLPTAILMGGSIVGIAYQTEKFLRNGASPLLWKTLFISAGFAVMYSVISGSWMAVGITLIFIAVCAIAFLRFPLPAHRGGTIAGRAPSRNVEKLENDMKKCC